MTSKRKSDIGLIVAVVLVILAFIIPHAWSATNIEQLFPPVEQPVGEAAPSLGSGCLPADSALARLRASGYSIWGSFENLVATRTVIWVNEAERTAVVLAFDGLRGCMISGGQNWTAEP